MINCLTRSLRLCLHTSQERWSASGNNALSIALVDRSASGGTVETKASDA